MWATSITRSLAMVGASAVPSLDLVRFVCMIDFVRP